jgi:peptide deformylase
MILPIVAYGYPVLKKKAIPIAKDFPELETLVDNMWETMYAASGVGLAAPQIGKSIRLFVVDASPFSENEELDVDEAAELADFKRVFVNPTIIEETGESWCFKEGCLSIPEIREEVFRKEHIKINFFDQNLKEHTLEYNGLAARIIQHEYDHIEGILFTDKLSPFKKKINQRKIK